jgi:hypothetical protein
MFIAINSSAIVQGFTLATVIPAVASTLKQAQREAAEALHCLAQYHARVSASGGAKIPIDAATRHAANRFGEVLVEQAINGSTFFMAVKLALMGFGAAGGVAAQLAITGNTIVTPQQTQKFNPARMVFEALGSEPHWVKRLSEEALSNFAYHSGAFAAFCGYGDASFGETPTTTPPSAPVHFRVTVIRPHDRALSGRQA